MEMNYYADYRTDDERVVRNSGLIEYPLFYPVMVFIYYEMVLFQSVSRKCV